MYALHAQQHLQNFILSAEESKDCQPKSEKPHIFFCTWPVREERVKSTIYSELVLISEDHQKVVYYGTGQVCKSTKPSSSFFHYSMVFSH